MERLVRERPGPEPLAAGRLLPARSCTHRVGRAGRVRPCQIDAYNTGRVEVDQRLGVLVQVAREPVFPWCPVRVQESRRLDSVQRLRARVTGPGAPKELRDRLQLKGWPNRLSLIHISE